MAPTVADIAGKTKDEIAHRHHLAAVERLRKAESELERTFEDLYKARGMMREVGITIDVEMRPSTGAAWDKFQATKQPSGTMRRVIEAGVGGTVTVPR